MATHSTVWTGILSSAATSVSVGDAVVMDTDGYFRVATTANRASYGRAKGIAISAASTLYPTFEYQVAGVCAESVVDLGAGADAWAIVNATGQLERDTTPDSGEDIVGKVDTLGHVQVCPGVFDSDNYAGGGGASTPTGDGFVRVTSGVQEAAASAVNLAGGATHVTGALPAGNGGFGSDISAQSGVPLFATGTPTFTGTTGTGLFARQTSPTFLTTTSYGASPSTAGEHRYTNNEFLWWRGGGANYQVLGMDASDVIILGGSGADITINASHPAGEITLLAGQVTVDGNAWRLREGSGAGNYLTLDVPDIAADRTLTFPLLTGNDTFVTEAHTQTLTNKTVSGPSFTASSFWSVGATPASAGEGRMPVGGSIRWKDSGAGDYYGILGSGDSVYIGTNASWGGQASAVNVYAAGNVALGVTSSTYLYLNSGNLESWKPRIGSAVGSSPYGSDGRATQAMADANQTLAASIYSRRIIRFTGALTAQRTATFPHPASEDASYEKLIVNDCTGNSVLVSTGTGTTVSVAAAGRAVMAFTPDGVMQIAS